MAAQLSRRISTVGRISMQRICVWIISAIATTLGVFAVGDVAAADNLMGTYGFTGTANCLVAPGSSTTPPIPGNTNPNPNAGFNSSLQPIDGQVFGFSFSVEGTRTFNGDGTGSVKGTAVSTTGETPVGPLFPNFRPDASSDNFTYKFTYVVNGDGSWTADIVPGTYTGAFVTGPRSISSQTYTIDKFPTLSGLVAVNGLTLTAAQLPPTVETHTYSNGEVWPMICHRSRVFIKL